MYVLSKILSLRSCTGSHIAGNITQDSPCTTYQFNKRNNG